MKYIKQLFTLILLLTTFSGNCKETLQYNLNVGDEFYYKVKRHQVTQDFFYKISKEIGDHAPPFVETSIKIIVKAKKKDHYQMAMKLVDYKKQFNLKAGDISKLAAFNDFVEKVNLQMLNRDINFTLGFDGKISTQIIPPVVQSDILTKAKVNNLMLRVAAKKISILSPSIQQEILEMIFCRFPKNNTQQWTTKSSKTILYPPLEKSYTLSSDSVKNPLITSKIDYNNVDSIIIPFTRDQSFMPNNVQQTGEIILHPSMYIMQEATIKQAVNYTSITTYRTKTQRKHTFTNHYLYKIKRIESPDKDSNVIIAGKLRHDSELDSIKFFVWNNYMEKTMFDERAKLNKNKTFKFKTSIPKAMEVSHNNKPWKMNYSFNNLLLEPGDSIFLDFGTDKVAMFSGKGALKCQLSDKVRKMGHDINSRLNLRRAKEFHLDNLDTKFEVVEPYKNQLSEWAYNHLTTDIYYAEMHKLLNYYTAKNRQKPNTEMFNNLFGDIKIDQYSTISSYEFRMFITKYIQEKQKINNPLYSNRLQPSFSKSYYYAKEQLTGDIRYFTLAYYILQALENSWKQNVDVIYNDFIKEYPGSEYTALLNLIHNKIKQLKVGASAPNFVVTDINGDECSLYNTYGKWVLLVFGNLDNKWDKEQLQLIANLQKELGDEDFELIIALNNPSKQIKAFVSKEKIRGTIVSNYDQNTDLDKYLTIKQNPTYMINPRGYIEYAEDGNVFRHDAAYVSDYIKDAIETQKKLMKSESSWIQVLYFILGFALSLGLTLFINRLRLKQLRKKEEERRERLELEMQAVRSQLNPHFLFNSMNSIQHLVNADENEKANIFLSKFGSLMRKVLNQSEEELIPLADELETISTYLELEALRHRFTYAINVEEGIDQYNIEIPPMLLQPFVENAVVHGISGMNTNGKIAVEVSRLNGDHIRIQIIDNGKGLHHKCSSKQSNGKGLHITQRRVDLMMEKFKHDISIDLKDAKESEATTTTTGTVAEIIVELEQ
ncbi:redoxin domain-containing protein [Puteibacter caeruleilacunae]|nr:redoxin domain-containing protein [Puteibacter caeruleilacunae]